MAKTFGTGKGIGSLIATLSLDTSGFYTGIASAGAAMKGLGKTLTTFVTLPLIALGTASVKMAMDFETSFARMQGLAGVESFEIEGLKKEVLALAEEMGRPPQELANSLYFIRSSGFGAAEAMELLRTSAMASRSGLGTTKVVADLLTTVLNAYGHANISAAQATDTLTAAVRLGKGEPEAFAAHLGYVVPIAAEMGVEFDQVAAAIAAMSRKMSSSDVSTAVVNLRQVLSDLLSPAEHSRAALEAWGTSATELRKVIREDGLLRALEFVNSKMKDNDEAFSEIFGNVRSLTGALSLAGVSAQGVAEVFADMKDNTGELAYALSVASNTAEDKFNRAMSSLRVAGIELGAQLLPIFIEVVGVIKQMANWFTSLSDEGKKTTIIILAIAAALGPVLLIMGSLISVITTLASSTGVAIAAVALLSMSFIYLYENWAAVTERIGDWSWWKNMMIDIVNYGITMWNRLITEVMSLMNMVIDEYNVLSGKIGGKLGFIDRFTWTDVMSAGIEEIKQETKEYEHQFKGFTESMTSFAKKAGAAISELLFPKRAQEHISIQDPGEGSLNDFTTEDSKPPFRPKKPTTWFGDGPIKDTTKAVLDLDQAIQGMVYRTLDDLSRAFEELFSGDFSAKSFFTSMLETVAAFSEQFAKQLIMAGIAALTFEQLLLNPAAAIIAGTALLAAVGAIKSHLNKGPVQAMATGGVVTQGGVFQLHRDELVALPSGAAVTPAHMATGGDGMGGGRLSTRISLRALIIETDKERRRMNR